jgi:hypothetical protein
VTWGMPMLLGPRQPRPVSCMQCRSLRILRTWEATSIPVLHDQYGRVLWYFVVCQKCFRRLPEAWQMRAVESTRPGLRGASYRRAIRVEV